MIKKYMCCAAAAGFLMCLMPVQSYAVTVQDIECCFVNAAEKAGKAVVTVNTMKYKRSGIVVMDPFGNRDRFMEEFFNEFFGTQPQKKYYDSGLGSGVIIDSEGHILTNYHVIKNADRIEIVLTDGRKFEGIVRGIDPKGDLAVLKVNAVDTLPFVPLGDSDTIRVGQWAIAIGNPFGFIVANPQPTVTVGVISAIHRVINPKLTGGEYIGDLIQTDAAINMGNSGGPLINLKGEVIGINEFILSTTGGNQGLGFAIPSNKAKRVLDDLIAGKIIEYGWMGVQVQDMTVQLSRQFNLPDSDGALVSAVVSGGPADKAGIKPGDIVTAVNDKEIRGADDLIAVVNDLRAYEPVVVKIIRDNTSLDVDVELGARPDMSYSMPVYRPGTPDQGKTIWRGMTVIELTPKIVERYNLRQQSGVIVVDIAAGSLAEQAGVHVGDIIIEVNREKIQTLRDFSVTISKVRGEALILTGRGYFVIGDQQ